MIAGTTQCAFMAALSRQQAVNFSKGLGGQRVTELTSIAGMNWEGKCTTSEEVHRHVPLTVHWVLLWSI